MKNIHIRRFATADRALDVQGLIEPEDQTWLVLIDANDQATFWRRQSRQEIDPVDCSETTIPESFYIDVELPGFGALHVGDDLTRAAPAENEKLEHADPVNPLDFEVKPNTEGPGYWAWFNARDIICFGATEHEAVRSLMNYAVRLAVAGCLDHTGRPVPGTLKRRYDAAFPPVELPDDQKNQPVPGLPPFSQ